MSTTTRATSPGPPTTAPPRGPALLAWLLPGVLALLVGAFVLATPSFVVADAASYGFRTDVVLPTGYVTTAVSPGALAAGACTVAAILLARLRPVWATGLALAPFVVVPWVHTWSYGWWLGLVAVAVVAARDEPRRAVVPLLTAVAVAGWYCGSGVPAVTPVGPVTSGSTAARDLVVLALHVVAAGAAVGIAAAAGAATRNRRRVLAAARATEQRARGVESVAAERARLARDLHDVVAHHVSLVAVRAESAPFQYAGLGDEARDVLTAIADDARRALGELRQVLVVLRRAESAELAPQPGATDVDGLVAAARGAGQRVEVVGEWDDVGPAAGYVLFRVVQEALTNARRHGGAEATTGVTRFRAVAGVGVRVTNDLAGRSVAGEPGRGLIGMRERVEALGGTLRTGVEDGRFVVEAVVPEVDA